ncbi:HNH endonuclease-domain-containing protein [Tribonema minus]|uniref:HNH endonuclease-domain-containing protein n=1 Tax=Tribonema minus TaxID=303371 RepID=A0A835Z2M0_9STRA|nr:HNH endonuclease-domain-containing protein [Tribonema minus]
MTNSNPWSDAPAAGARITGKRRRRSLHPQETLARGAQRELERDDASAKKKMVPAVSFMTVRDERRALQEIRAMKDPKPNQQLTSCDMSVALFALRFIEIPDDAEIIDAEGVRWRQVPGHPHYNISSIGTVMNHTTGSVVAVQRHRARISNTEAISTAKYRILLASIKGKRRSAHRLVASAWIGEIPDKHVVDHIDEVPSNNDVSNLRIVTRSENGNHSRVVSVAIEQRSEKTEAAHSAELEP